jgi:DNA repair photolyase
VEWKDRHGPALRPSPLSTGGDVLAVNLAAGCAHRCAFCSARAYLTHPGDDVLHLFRKTPERVAEELAARRVRPRAVFVSPSTDPFPPLAEVQAATARLVELLAGHGVEAWLMTRGFIRPSALEVLRRHRDHVRLTVGLTTLDRGLQRVLEPLAAPPRMRLRQLARLRSLGVAVRVAVEPLVPGVTDTRANLSAVLEALAAVGVRHVTTGYLFLRPGIQAHLAESLQTHGLDDAVLSAFEGGPWLKTAQLAAAKYLPKARRQRGYAALMALAAEVGITVSVCALTNPDFSGSRPAAPARQRLLSFS